MLDGLFPSQTEVKPLRSHQVRSIEALKLSLGRGNRRPVLALPTGAGKTRIAAEIVKGARAKGNRVAFCVPALSLIDQTVDAFRAEGIGGIGVMQSQHPLTNRFEPVQIASVQTLGMRERPDANVVIVDEVHIRSKAIEDWIAAEPGKVFIGLSATPWRRGMGLVWDDLIVGATIGELIDAEYLSPFRVFASGHPELSGVSTVAGEYHQGELGETMADRKLVADIVTTWVQHGEDRPTLCFAVDRAHAAKIAAEFEAAGVPSGYVDAFTDRIERQIVQRKFEAGEIKVVCNCRTLTTGVDWAIGCIIDAAPTRSPMLHVQKIGRGLRVNPGLSDCVILDHADNSLRLGLVTDIHRTALDATKPGEKAKAEKKDPLPKECSKCNFLKPPKVSECPCCGFKPEARSEIECEDGELVEITGAKKPKATMAEKQAFFSGLLGYCHTHGKSQGFASHTFRERFGVWPNAMDRTVCTPSEDVLRFVKAKQIRFAKGRARHAA